MPQQQSMGTCMLCGATASQRAMPRHLESCAGGGVRATSEDVVRLRVESPGSPFWMDVEAQGKATLRQLDEFLRRVWLECCGHLSRFTIGRQRYVVELDDDFLGARPTERSMDVALVSVMPAPATPFTYEYDFGTSGKPATALCAECAYEEDPFACDEHIDDHECGDEAMLPVVNLPRMGMCGYTG